MDSAESGGVAEVGVEIGAAIMLFREVVRVLDPPSDLVTMEVTTTTLVVEPWALLLFASMEVVPVGSDVAVPVVTVDGDVVVVPRSVLTLAAESGEPLPETVTLSSSVSSPVSSSVDGRVEVDTLGVGESLGAEFELLGGASPAESTIARFSIEKRSFDVLQQALLTSPSASGRLASQQ